MEREPEQQQFFGTSENGHYIWCNSTDKSGIILSLLVWSIFVYIIFVLLYFMVLGFVDLALGIPIVIIVSFGWLCHIKTMFSDPGTVPSNAKLIKGLNSSAETKPLIPVCGICEAYKPPKAHHGFNYCSLLFLFMNL